MRKLFFATCAVLVCIAAIAHFTPKVGNVATSVPVDGAQFPVTYAMLLGVGLIIVFWRMQAKS